MSRRREERYKVNMNDEEEIKEVLRAATRWVTSLRSFDTRKGLQSYT